MSEALSFEDLIRQVRGGDQDAATELVRRYEPAIRRSVRFRLAGAGLRPKLDSMDICQSVLASFFVRAASGQYDLDKAEQLVGLLTTMAHNKLARVIRRELTAKQGGGKVRSGLAGAERLVAPDAGPGREAAARELLDEAQRRLSPEERRLVELRGQGLRWDAIAAQLGGSAEALRKQLARALDRVSGELGLDESDHE